MTQKKRILFVPSDLQGTGSWRCIWPATIIEKNHSKDFEVEINQFPNLEDMDYITKFDIIHFHRQLGLGVDEERNIAHLKSLGIKLVMDIDDYWEPFTGHPLYLLIKNEKFPERVMRNIKSVDYVTTTTKFFKEEIEKLNPNAQVFIMPNSVNLDDKMWKSAETRQEGDNKCRITWIGGSSHLLDLQLLKDSFSLLHSNQELKGKYQVSICGFDTRGTVTQIDEFGNQKQRPIQPKETCWARFEEIFTDNYRLVSEDKEYSEWLQKIDKGEYKDQYLKPYMRRWTLPLTQYAKHYDYCDVCLAPLDEYDVIRTPKGQIIKQENIFNKVKSELKIIEAGVKKKALIAQDFAIYRDLLTDGENALLVDKNEKGWYKAMRKVILDKDYREMLAQNLHDFVIKKYDIKMVTEDRVDIYKEILEINKNVLAS